MSLTRTMFLCFLANLTPEFGLAAGKQGEGGQVLKATANQELAQPSAVLMCVWHSCCPGVACRSLFRGSAYETASNGSQNDLVG